MSHSRYPACLTMHRLHLSVNLGRWEDERARAQPIEVSVKFFFPELPLACTEDKSDIMCYDDLSAELGTYVADKNFLHIEYLAVQLFQVVRGNMCRQMGAAYDNVKVWVRVHKFNAPIPSLTGGASFVYTDLPEGTAIAHE